MAENYSLLQWNCQGLRAKKDELLQLINIHKPDIIALQETMLGNNPFNISCYSIYNTCGHYNRRPHGGTAILIHNSVPHKQIQLNNDCFQITVVKVALNVPLLIASIYISRSHNIAEPQIKSLLDELLSSKLPVLILGDFNAYNTAWGCESTDARGKTLLSSFDIKNLNILNSGDPTCISNMSQTPIDLSICSPCLSPSIEWSILESPYGSDHYPIKLSVLKNIEPIQSCKSNYNMKKCHWPTYTNHKSWSKLTHIRNTNDSLQNLYQCIEEALQDSTPTYKTGRFFPKPWWSLKLQDAFEDRENAFSKFKRNKTVNHLIDWKRKRAYFSFLRKNEKSKYWQEMCNSLNSKTPITQIYSTVRNIKGKKSYTISPITENNKTYFTIPEIANQLGIAIANSSSINSCTRDFIKIKEKAESSVIHFESSNDEDYNREFTMDELNHAINVTRSSAPGPDAITIDMLKNLPLNAKQFTLKLFNKMFKESYFPSKWSQSLIVPIPKPGKDRSNPYNYRPIALTSVVCKTIERLINRRLLDFCDRNKLITNIQCGGRPKSSTVDHLIRLEHNIKKSFVLGEHFVSVFFDLEKAYDQTWRYGILRDMHSMGLRGLIPKFISEFLKHRTFKIKLQNHLSESFTQDMGIPQGSVLSVLLFAIKINSIVKVIPVDTRYHISLFVDDFQLAYRHADINIVQKKMQIAVNSIQCWAHQNGCKFSSSKTKMVHFHNKKGIYLSPKINLYNKKIESVKSHKFLGLMFDEKLTWQPHMSMLVNSSRLVSNLIKSLTSYKWGASQTTLLHLFRIMLRSKWDYGCEVYNSATPSILKQLDTMHNDNLRIISGAFRTSPIQSLQVILNEMSLEKRRIQMSLRYFHKTISRLSNPAYNCINDYALTNSFKSKKISPPFAIRARQYMSSLELPSPYVMKDFSYSLANITQSSLSLSPIKIDLSLTLWKKSSTPLLTYKTAFYELSNSKYPKHTKTYTDGSKTACGVGAAAISGKSITTASLPCEASILSAELYAIKMAITKIKLKTQHISKYHLICTDSLSSLTLFSNIPSKHPLVRLLQHEISSLNTLSVEIVLMWVPSHCGILGNERADLAAQMASTKKPEYISIIYSDYFHNINRAIHKSWNQEWTSSNNKMVEIFKNIDEVPSPLLCRKKQVILNRLRIGHCKITHDYLLDNNIPRAPTECMFCNRDILTVKHFLSECPNLQQLLKTLPNFRDLLCSGGHSLFLFLDALGIQEQI